MEEDTDSYAVFGTPLEPLEQDEIPTKRPIQVQDQKVYDENGLQRFHGAFTGGFSAGYFNTVGTKEGWTPSEFVSSRSQKASKAARRPEDYMDAEDLREYGIAPMRIHAKEQFRKESSQSSRSLDRRPQVIPGAAPLLDIVRPVTKSIGAVLLQKLGWRPGKGVGPQKMVPTSDEKIYGCALPPSATENRNQEVFSDSFVVSPADVNILPYTTKSNVYGLGYVSLSEAENFSVSSMISESVSGHIKMGKGVKKVAFTGQAFGVGAFEDDDEDIYGRDDLSKYDFSLEDEKESRRSVQSKNSKQPTSGNLCLKGFVVSSKKWDFTKKHFPPPLLPPGYVPKYASLSIQATRTPSVGTGRFLNRFAFSAVDRKKILGSRFSDPSPKLEQEANADRDSSQKLNSEEEILDSPAIAKQTDSVVAPPLKFQTILNSKFVSSSSLEVEEVIYGLSRPTVSTGSTKVEPDSNKTACEHKCKRLVELWHPVALLCKRFNVPDPFHDSGLTLAAAASRPSSQKPSIFRSLFETTKMESEIDQKTVLQSTEPPEGISTVEDCNPERDVSVSSSASPCIQEPEITQKSRFVSKSPVPDEDFKPPTPPTMDLFKEIFQDTSSDEADEPSDKSEDESKNIPETENKSDFTSTETPSLEKSKDSSEVTILSPPPEKPFEPELYGPALPPQGVAPVNSVFTPRVSLESHKSSKRKAKKRKSHHKSHKKHKRKKSKYSKDLSGGRASDSEDDSSDINSDGDDKEVNLKLIKRLKDMKKR